jgi:hypothetical protein
LVWNSVTICPRRATGADDNNGLVGKVYISNRSEKASCIGVGSDQRATIPPKQGVCGTDTLTHPARISNMVEHSQLVGDGNIASPPVGVSTA